MQTARRKFGDGGEDHAVAFLKGKGLRILARQVRTMFGEIDIVCEDGKEIVLVEVKTRRTSSYGRPEDSITYRKFNHMAAAAHVFLGQKGWGARPWRLDVIAIVWPFGGKPNITHYQAVDSAAVV